MAENKHYVAFGEEAARGTKEATTVGFIPLLGPFIPNFEPQEKYREEFRGEDTGKGETAVRRMSRHWSGSMEMPFFTEAGTVAGMVGTLFKHFFGHVASAQNGATGQYAHMFSRPADPFATADLGAKALTANVNINEGATMKNWPYVGGRIKSLTFDQEVGQELKVTAEMMGQFRDTVTAEIGSPAFAAENLRCDYNNLAVYFGAGISRTGSGPDFTDIAKGTMVQLKPDKISVTIDNGMDDVLRLSGLDYPDKTRMNGKIKATVELIIDWEDPATGFSSVDEFNSWVDAPSSTSLLLVWDTGTQAGTGDNHGLILDIPITQRRGGNPDYNRDADPMITLNYEGLQDDTTTKYTIGALLKNTASAV